MNLKLVWFAIVTFIEISMLCTDVSCGEDYLVRDFWNEQAENDLIDTLERIPNENVAKNVILFIGDGMGVSTVTAARILKGQLNGKPGEETVLSFEEFPYVGLAKTYTTNRQVSDSAGTGTALLCGVKTKGGVLGVDDRIIPKNCSSENGAAVDSIIKWSEEEGKSTGIVTTTRITHATPGAAYAHSASRSWEHNGKLEKDAGPNSNCKDIAVQMIENAAEVQVILGGGRAYFVNSTVSDPEYPAKSGKRSDGKNLIEEWKQSQRDQGKTFKYVWNNADFKNVDPETTDSLLGLFEPSHMQYAYDLANNKDGAGEPTIAEMTAKAIDMLSKNENGFFLLVEGGRIDHGHHDSKPVQALYDTLAFDEAIQIAKEMTEEDDTLIVVTADHSHVFTIGGYPTRGNPIFAATDTEVGGDGMPYTTLLYGNGPGGNHTKYPLGRENITNVNTASSDYVSQSAVLVEYESHGGEDVAIYAQGPMSHLFDGVHEQHYVAHVMAYSACVGPYLDHCWKKRSTNGYIPGKPNRYHCGPNAKCYDPEGNEKPCCKNGETCRPNIWKGNKKRAVVSKKGTKGNTRKRLVWNCQRN